jgi:hypothetical protein
MDFYWGVLYLAGDSYAKLGFVMSEMKCGSVAFNEKPLSENVITVQGQEKKLQFATCRRLLPKVTLDHQRVTAGD